MGQRLVVTIHAFNEDVAKIYYHWSGYSISALCEARDIIENVKYKEATDVKNLQLMLIRYLESYGGGVDSIDRAAVRQMFPTETFTEEVNRSYGLIAISDAGMEDLQRWSEGDLTINFDEEEVFNSVWCLETRESLKEMYYGERPKAVKIKGNIEEVKFNDLDDLARELDKVIRSGYVVVYSNGIYASLIA